MNSTLTNNQPENVFLKMAEAHRAIKKAENARRREQRLRSFYAIDPKEVQASVDRVLAKQADRTLSKPAELAKRAEPLAAPARVSLATYLHAAAPTAIDLKGEQHQVAGLIKIVHRAGGAPLTPNVPALRKVDAAPPVPATEPGPPDFNFESMTEAEAWAHATRQENEADAERAASFRQALAGQGLAIGGKR